MICHCWRLGEHLGPVERGSNLISAKDVDEFKRVLSDLER